MPLVFAVGEADTPPYFFIKQGISAILIVVNHSLPLRQLLRVVS